MVPFAFARTTLARDLCCLSRSAVAGVHYFILIPSQFLVIWKSFMLHYRCSQGKLEWAWLSIRASAPDYTVLKGCFIFVGDEVLCTHRTSLSPTAAYVYRLDHS